MKPCGTTVPDSGHVHAGRSDDSASVTPVPPTRCMRAAYEGFNSAREEFQSGPTPAAIRARPSHAVQVPIEVDWLDTHPAPFSQLTKLTARLSSTSWTSITPCLRSSRAASTICRRPRPVSPPACWVYSMYLRIRPS